MAREARFHLEFVFECYRWQHTNGRLCLYEHPDKASSWREGTAQDMLERPEVYRVTSDMWAFRMTSIH
eukprot:12882950-Prorocentrum_lima.AAC.1